MMVKIQIVGGAWHQRCEWLVISYYNKVPFLILVHYLCEVLTESCFCSQKYRNINTYVVEIQTGKTLWN